jgi:hypothetical protein
MNVTPDDELSRCIIYSKAFASNIHVDGRLFVFGQTGADGASHESGVLRRLAQADDEVHRIGCNIAHIQNERIQPPPPPGPKRRYYCGFRTAKVRDLCLEGEGYSIKLCLDGEGGMEAHVDIALTIFSQDGNERATIRTDAGLAMADAFGPAATHLCPADAGDNLHPLIVYPGCLGALAPSRSVPPPAGP